MKKLLTLLVLVVLIFSCGENDQKEEFEQVPQQQEDSPSFHLVKCDSLFSVDLPSDLDSVSVLSEPILLNYSNLFREQHLFVEGKDKEDLTFDDYVTHEFQKIEDRTKMVRRSEWLNTEINGLHSKLIALDGDFSGASEVISHWLAFIEGDKYFYMIKISTPEKRKELFEGKANKIIFSFKEV